MPQRALETESLTECLFFCFLYPEKKGLFELVENDSRSEESSTVLGQSPQRLTPC